MFVDDLKKDFYDKIFGQFCLILVNFDVDAICASKILQSLFKNDHMVYTMVAVQGIKDIKLAYREHRKQVNHVIMINCGGTIDIHEELSPEPDTVFYVLDSHKPHNLYNIYSQSQIKILDKGEEDSIPDYDEVFSNDSARIHRICEEYYQSDYYGKSSALSIFDMAWKMSRDTLDMAWYAIVGTTERFLLKKVETIKSLDDTATLQAHISRLSRSRGQDIEKQHSSINLSYDEDLQLALYRHWTIESSLRHTMQIAISLRLYTLKGEQRLKTLLAEMGLPLEQSKKPFPTMDLSLRKELHKMMKNLSDRQKIPSIVSGSFVFQYGFRFKYCSSDVVYAMLAVMESSSKGESPQKCLLDAADCLSYTNRETLTNGVDKAKLMLCNIYKMAQTILETKTITRSGALLHATVPEGTLDSQMFAHPHALTMLAHLVLGAFTNWSGNETFKSMPFVIFAPFIAEEGKCLVCGVPPVSEDQVMSCFGMAFREAEEVLNISIDMDYCDHSIIRINTLDKAKFIEALTRIIV